MMFSSMSLADIQRDGVCAVGDETEVVFCWCEFLVRTSMVVLMRKAKPILNPPIAPTIHTMSFSFPSTPSQLIYIFNSSGEKGGRRSGRRRGVEVYEHKEERLLWED